MMQPRIRLLIAFAGLLTAAGASAAPDEEQLGKAEGYPICPGLARPETRCLVGLVSRFDELFPARKVARGVTMRPLKRAAAEPVIRYTSSYSRTSELDFYLSRNRTTGILILKDAKSKLVMVHTAAREISDGGGEVTSLWLGIVQSLGN